MKHSLVHPQSMLLTDSLRPIFTRRHAAGDYFIGQGCGITWRFVGEDPERGVEVFPGWYYVPGVPALLDSQLRWSYVLRLEVLAPLLLVEFVAGDGSEERDRTKHTGKFWVYENAIRAPFYAIYEVHLERVEVYHLVDGGYELMPPNERGHFPIKPLGVELGIWQGRYGNMDLPWLRAWDDKGKLLLTGEERAEEAQRRAERLANQLRALGVEPQEG